MGKEFHLITKEQYWKILLNEWSAARSAHLQEKRRKKVRGRLMKRMGRLGLKESESCIPVRDNVIRLLTCQKVKVEEREWAGEGAECKRLVCVKRGEKGGEGGRSMGDGEREEEEGRVYDSCEDSW